MIAIDASAIIAILQAETEAPDFVRRIASARRTLISAPTVLEIHMVAGRKDAVAGPAAANALIQRVGLEIVDFGRRHLLEAREAFDRFGKGRHKAGLNFGDCIAYALARAEGVPLLFKGGDFAQTDVETALP